MKTRRIQTLLASALLCAAPALASSQEPVHQDPKAPGPSTAEKPLRGFAAWGKMQRLAGGEWHAGMHFPMQAIHRFEEGPAGSSIFLTTLDKENLAKTPTTISVIYHDPGLDEVVGIAIDKVGTMYEGRYYWLGETLVNEMSVHTETSVLQGSEVTSKVASSDYVGRWTFESKDAYRWQLFSKSTSGVAPMEGMETVFSRKTDLTELPEAKAAEPSKPLKDHRFLTSLSGAFAAEEGGWSLTGEWRAGSRVLWVQRTLPNPLRDGPLDVEGFYYWSPFAKEFQFLGFSKLGDLVRGSTKNTDGKQIKTTYRITPVATKDVGVLAEDHWGQLTEVLTPLAEGLLKVDWVLIAPGTKPKIVNTQLVGR